MSLKHTLVFVALSFVLPLSSMPLGLHSPANAKTSTSDANNAVKQVEALAWVKGPATVSIASKANVKIPSGYMYLSEADTSRFLEINGNLPQPGRYTIAREDFKWFAVYAFSPDGYVKDDDAINAPEIFKAMKEAEPAENEERRKAGLEPMYLDGWVVEPHYEPATRYLEWGTRLHSTDQASIVNYTSRMLGRSGVMSVVLVSDPTSLTKDLADFRSATKTFAYVPGEKYEEFRSGDKVAEYGLGALIVGGAAAAAAKSGAGKVIAGFAKVIIVGIGAVFIALISFIKNLFARRKAN